MQIKHHCIYTKENIKIYVIQNVFLVEFKEVDVTIIKFVFRMVNRGENKLKKIDITVGNNIQTINLFILS